jgi:hypothetical protein
MTVSYSSSTNETNIDSIIIGMVILIGLLVCIPVYQKNSGAILLRIKRVLTKNAHVVIVSTYGPTVGGSPFYESYIAQLMTYVLDPSNKVSEMIIVGGYTVDQSVSQSRAVLNYIEEKYPSFSSTNIAVTLDECGITTWQNIRNAKSLMAKEGIKSSRITIFAEESRDKKVYFFANTTFNDFYGNDEKSILRETEELASASKGKQLVTYNLLPTMVTGEYTGKMGKTELITVPAGLPKEYIDDEQAQLFSEIKEYLDPTYGHLKVKERLDNWAKAAGFNTIENLVDKGCVEYKRFLD